MNAEITAARRVYRWLWLSPLLTVPTFFLVAFYLDWPAYDLICGDHFYDCDYALVELTLSLVATFVSALWHLVLLKPALNRQSEFVRWHGRQALLLAGVRIAISLLLAGVRIAISLTIAVSYSYRHTDTIIILSVLASIATWLFGTLWGQIQAGRGDCALMRWAGHGAGLPLPTQAAQPAGASADGGRGGEVAAIEQGRPAEAEAGSYAAPGSDALPKPEAQAAGELSQIGGPLRDQPAEALVAIFRFSPDPEERRRALDRLKQLGLVEAL